MSDFFAFFSSGEKLLAPGSDRCVQVLITATIITKNPISGEDFTLSHSDYVWTPLNKYAGREVNSKIKELKRRFPRAVRKQVTIKVEPDGKSSFDRMIDNGEVDIHDLM